MEETATRKRRKNQDNQIIVPKVDLERTLEENKKLRLEKWEKDKLILKEKKRLVQEKYDLWQEKRKVWIERLEDIRLQRDYEEAKFNFEIEFKKADPKLFICFVDDILQFLKNPDAVEGSLGVQLRKIYRKAITHIASCRKQQMETIASGLLKHKRKRNDQEKIIKPFSASGLGMKSNQKEVKDQSVPKETGSFMLAICLGEIKVQDISSECLNCRSDDGKPIPLQHVEKPEPRLVCPKCGIFTVIDEVYFEAGREKESNDSNGWGSIGHKHNIPEVLRKFVEYDTNYFTEARFPLEIISEVYCALFQEGKSDISNLKWEELDNILKELADSKTDQIYKEIAAHSYSVFCTLRGVPLITFTPEEKERIYETYQRFVHYWNESEGSRERAVNSTLAWLFTLLACEYPKEVVSSFHPAKTFDSFKDENKTFIYISEKMGLKTPITFDKISPKYAQITQSSKQTGIFKKEAPVAAEVQKSNPVFLPKKAVTMGQIPKSTFRILD